MTAGTTNELTITAQDDYGNTDTSYSGTKFLQFTGLSNVGAHYPTWKER